MTTSRWNPDYSMDYPHCDQCPTTVPISVHDASLAEPTYVASRCDWDEHHEFDAGTAVFWAFDAADRPYRRMHVSCAWCLVTQDTFCEPELRVGQPGVVMALRGVPRWVGCLDCAETIAKGLVAAEVWLPAHARAELAGYRSATEPAPLPQMEDEP